MKRFSTRKSFRLDQETSDLLGEIARNSFGKESTLIRKHVRAGALRDGERYADQTKRVLDATKTLKRAKEISK